MSRGGSPPPVRSAEERGGHPAPSHGCLRLAVLLSFLLLTPGLVDGQALRDVSQDDLHHVMPDADRFSERNGNPPVFRAYRTDPDADAGEILLGYAFLTSDLPPEVRGYDAPIDVLVGMDQEGTITGVRILRHRESLRRTRGDFFETRGFQEQFAGKHVTDPFRVRRDVDNISGATISVDAMARGVRNAARRVATSVVNGSGEPAREGRSERGAPLSVEELERMSWMDIVASGPIHRLAIVENGVTYLEMLVLDIRERRAGELLLGAEQFESALEDLGDRAHEDHLLLIGLEGSIVRWRPTLMSLIQGSDTFSVANADIAVTMNPSGGMVGGELRSVGVWAVDRRIEMSEPFTIAFGGALGMDVFTLEYPGRPSVDVVAAGAEESAEAPEWEEGAEEAALPVEPEAPAADTEEGEEAEEEAEREEEASVPPEERAGEGNVAPAPVEPDQEAIALSSSLDLYEFEEEESQLSRTLARTSWGRFGALVLLLGLVTAAFASKKTALRWVTLTGTLVYLGFVDGGFLSVSHITSGIRVGPGVYLNDLSLLLIVVFTLVTTLLWGRVFCGYLCPFGALQDFLERIVPRRFKREVPQWIHDRALLLKYLILLLVLAPALMVALAPTLGENSVSLYQYFEPFGTVFFLSPSILLWTIALGFLVASAIVPRFYCRYFCPLGAALAVTARVSPFRIRRVEQCTLCKVCEQSCPTGAIRGAEIDFPECVRCSVCEVKLIEKAGACRHDMEGIRPRLVQLQVPSR